MIIINQVIENGPLFKDIGGYEYQKEEAMRISNFFKNYDEYYSKGARLPKGVIFFGDPGTGKTMFAKAISNEANVPLIQLNTDDFYLESNVSVAIKNKFEEAKEKAPSIVLIDELDRIVNCERSFQKNESDKQREALRTLLTEIDKIQDKGVLVVATANTDICFIPSALVRNGRIEKHIEIDIPSKEDRKSILDIYLSSNESFKNVSNDDIAAYTANFTGASLAALANDVLINCISQKKEASFNDFLDPIEAIRTSSSKKKQEKNNKPVIYHELGHFIADYVLNNKIGMINVVPYGKAGGRYCRVEFDGAINDNSNRSFTDMYNECIVAISGLVATEVFLNEPYMGAANDLEKVTSYYTSMLKSGLFNEKELAIHLLGTMDYNVPYNDTRSDISESFARFLVRIKSESRRIINENKKLIEELYTELEKKSVLTHNEIEEIVNKTNNGKEVS